MVGKKPFLGRLGNPEVTTLKHTQWSWSAKSRKRRFLGRLGNNQVTTIRHTQWSMVMICWKLLIRKIFGTGQTNFVSDLLGMELKSLTRVLEVLIVSIYNRLKLWKRFCSTVVGKSCSKLECVGMLFYRFQIEG